MLHFWGWVALGLKIFMFKGDLRIANGIHVLVLYLDPLVADLVEVLMPDLDLGITCGLHPNLP